MLAGKNDCKQLYDSLNELLGTIGVKLAWEEITHLFVLVRGPAIACMYPFMSIILFCS